MQGILKYSFPQEIKEGPQKGLWFRQITEDWINGHRDAGSVYFDPTKSQIVQHGERYINNGVTFRWSYSYMDDEKEKEMLYWGNHNFDSGDLVPEDELKKISVRKESHVQPPGEGKEY